VLKKLDKLIIKSFIGPFVATFFITLMVLVIQFFWLYIDDFVGKGLSAGVILEFIWYQSAALVPLALPLSVLLSSLMTFGNLGESFELVAVKSAGISLVRFMRPLLIVTVLICAVAFSFANYIIPVANLKSKTLLADIVYAKPAFDLKEGVFYDKISGYSIKIGTKEKNDSIIRDVIIYDQNNPLQDNFMIAESGVMRISPNKRFLEFHLKNGMRYEEKGDRTSTNTDYIRVKFKEYKKQFDLSSFQFSRTADSINRNHERMLSLRQLDKALDSLEKNRDVYIKNIKAGLFTAFSFNSLKDSSWKLPDSLMAAKIKSLDAIIPDSAKSLVNQYALSRASSAKSNIDSYITELENKSRLIKNHRIEWQKKLALSFTCLVLFLIGAPLGSIIRKGGLGTPLVFAIIFFVLFYFVNRTGEQLAKAETLTPFGGLWLANLVLLPVGLFLTFKARKDAQLFNKEFYFRALKKLKLRLLKK
jgi:lipopolysaccharide export system permease protein